VANKAVAELEETAAEKFLREHNEQKLAAAITEEQEEPQAPDQENEGGDK
jgi:hypothetical protein